ncbi:MAG TPA: Ig-like domain-containing protein, partial [Acidimicrobiales bacterium]|nr:Ig-like domain-containing protein [Acidimicrobiales bacterium]
MSSEARRGRPTRQGGFGRSSTLIFGGGALVVTALLVVAVVGGLSTKHPGGQASPGGNGKSAKATKGAKAADATDNVTTTTTHAEAIDQLLSKVSMSPANGSTKQPLSTVVTLRASGARLEGVRVSVLPGGGKLKGAMGPAGDEWHSTGKLYPGTTYTVHYTVVGTSPGPGTSAATTTGTEPSFSAKGSGTFTTAPPASIVTASVFPSPGIAVGVGQPIVFMFSQPVDTLAAQEAVESHLSIAMSKPVPGGWHWFSSVELHFRPTSNWPVGDQVEVNGNLDRWHAGGAAWGEGVVSTAFVIGNSHISVVNLTTHQMTVTDNGRLLYTWPISAGQPRWPTQDGTHIVLDRESVVHMISSTVGIPVKSPAGYNEFVYWDVHISDSGEYVHAAPWSVSEQGFQNVSHGCVNLGPAEADVFFHFSRVGDIIDVVDGVRPPLQGDHGVMDWSFGGSVTWTPARVTRLTTSVTTVPITSLPPPPGAPTGAPVPTVPPPSTTTTATPTTTTTPPHMTTTRATTTVLAPSTTLVVPATSQPAPTTAKSVLTTVAKPALARTRPVTTTTRVAPTTLRPAPTTTKHRLATATKPAPTTTRAPSTT